MTLSFLFLGLLILATASAQTNNCTDLYDCGREFCGVDGVCHSYSCPNWFQYGGSVSSVIDDGTALTCEDYTTGEEDFYHAVIFSCGGFGPGVDMEGDGVSQVWNRRCYFDAGDELFECFHLAPDTDFSAFVNQAEANPPQPCDYSEEEIARGSPTNASYIYQVVISKPPSFISFRRGPESTATLDVDSAMMTMYAKVTSSQKTPEPTASLTVGPSTASPTVSTSAAISFRLKTKLASLSAAVLWITTELTT
ncbi:expressed unknown protein [Seminavis robusta]|uniref:Uncharacterized protein n=1 Tax=Seminavis robusta TaxID=568900 RepID=A0A9N8EYT5_9STRA|nr:expressed unknown protein [Seminavis robusta]|eukprot:Sro2333_g323740.1 n/a (252) ;mRNA; r:14333-15088